MRQLSSYTSESRGSRESGSVPRKDKRQEEGLLTETQAWGSAAQWPDGRAGSLRMWVQVLWKNYKFHYIIWPNQLHNQTLQNIQHECSKYGQSKLQKTTSLRNYMV